MEQDAEVLLTSRLFRTSLVRLSKGLSMLSPKF